MAKEKTVEERLAELEKTLAAVIEENGRNGSRCAALEKQLKKLTKGNDD